MNKEEKQQELALLKDKFSTSQLAVLANYQGLTVAQITKLRRELRGVKASARVAKNNLAIKVFKEIYKDDNQADVEKITNLFTGPNFVTFSTTDLVGPAKVLTKFAKENEKFQIKGAWLDGAFLDKKEVDQLSKMPSREETLAKLLNLLMTPATRVVQLLQAPGSQFVRLLAAYRTELEKKGGA
ncbi:MAG: 50S ribosomal protein L10 [bacterium]|nr:50S ribosomal protein L10 [bacterium]